MRTCWRSPYFTVASILHHAKLRHWSRLSCRDRESCVTNLRLNLGSLRSYLLVDPTGLEQLFPSGFLQLLPLSPINKQYLPLCHRCDDLNIDGCDTLEDGCPFHELPSPHIRCSPLLGDPRLKWRPTNHRYFHCCCDSPQRCLEVVRTQNTDNTHIVDLLDHVLVALGHKLSESPRLSRCTRWDPLKLFFRQRILIYCKNHSLSSLPCPSCSVPPSPPLSLWSLRIGVVALLICRNSRIAQWRQLPVRHGLCGATDIQFGGI